MCSDSEPGLNAARPFVIASRDISQRARIFSRPVARRTAAANRKVVRDGFVSPTEAGLSEAAWLLLDVRPGQMATWHTCVATATDVQWQQRHSVR